MIITILSVMYSIHAKSGPGHIKNISKISSYPSVTHSVVSALLCVCYMTLSSGASVTSSCSLYQLSSRLQDHHCQLILRIPTLLFKSSSSMLLCVLFLGATSVVFKAVTSSQRQLFLFLCPPCTHSQGLAEC